MKNKYVFVVIMLLSILLISFGFTNIYVSKNNEIKKEDEFVVVTSFYPMYIAAMNVVDDIEGVTLKNLSEPQTGCLHDFQLTPEEMKLLSTADVFLINGGGIESFMEDIAESYPNLTIVEACEGIELLHGGHEHEHEEDEIHEEHEHEEELNAHAWMSIDLYRKQIENITEGLAKADSSHADLYQKNANRYDEKLMELEKLQQEVKKQTVGQEVILFHCAYDYVANDLELPIAFCMDLDEERQVSAKEVADVVDVIYEHQVSYIFAEQLYGESMCNMIQKETDVNVVYLDPLTRGSYEKDSYINGMEHNLMLIKNAFSE